MVSHHGEGRRTRAGLPNEFVKKVRNYALATIVAAGCSVLASDPPTYQHPTGYDDYQVVRITIGTENHLKSLRQLEELGLEFEVWSEVARIGLVDVCVSPVGLSALAASGLRFTVLIENLQTHIDDLYQSPRGSGFFDSLQPYEAHRDFLADLAASRPELAEIVNFGFSVKGRPLWGIRITGPGDSKPGVFFHGAQHGNEQGGASLTTYFAQHLLLSYDTDASIAELVDNVEFFLLPITNPDGYVSYRRYNFNGYDLNRNWGGPATDSYAFSQPETAAMRDFFTTHPNIRLHLDIHGYVNWFLWPWGHTYATCADDATYQRIGAKVQDLISEAGGGYFEVGTIQHVAYEVVGGSIDYSYGDFGVWAVGLELRSSNVPSAIEHYLSSILYLAEWTYDCNGNSVPDLQELSVGAATDCNGNRKLDECEALPDCNANAVPDLCDIQAGESVDCDLNAVPDACDIALNPNLDCNANLRLDQCEWISGGDFDGDALVELDDFYAFTTCTAGPGATPSPPNMACVQTYLDAFDLDGDGDVDLRDFAAFERVMGGP